MLLCVVSLDRTCSSAGRCGLCQLSHIGTSQLITDRSPRSTDSNSANVGFLSSDHVSAVLMLPRLENVLRQAVEDLQQSPAPSSHEALLPSLSKPSMSSTIGPADKTVVALQQLLALVRYSRHVRRAITTSHTADLKTDDVALVQVDFFPSLPVG